MATIGQWLWYVLQFPGCPFSAPRGSADVILVQAFGRNELEDKDLARLRQYHDEHGSNDAVTLAWCRERVEVGQVNRSLAMELTELIYRTDLPIVAQWEAIVPLPVSWFDRHRSRITCLWPSATSVSGFPTRDVLSQSLEVMSMKGLSHPMVLANTGHVMRVAMMLKRMTGVWPTVHQSVTDDFDDKSVQPWTRSRAAWTLYEFFVRGHHLVHRWV